ncbi:MFS transporter [Verticiella sediminum]|uniref:MFS transporter n=1 Tax=Verticiella sediminum TaxID=1247510 RepID=A0A556A7P7_9BURK|nr:MFS transporter [Verticiella sediminum]TSH88900.1 MFS transporter [Verticiella sediminum]
MHTPDIHAPARPALAELAMAIGGFAIGIGEFVIMGLLPQVAAGTGVSVPQAGHLISTYAVGVVVGAPLIAVLAARLPRRLLLILLMAAFALGNFASAAAPGFLSLAGFRFVSGLPHGAFFGVAALVAAELAGPGRRAQAVARVMLGLTGATLVGVPIATWLGQTLGWQAAFVLVGAIGILCAALVWRWVPYTPGNPLASPLRELGALRRPQVLLTLAIGSIGFGGLFAVFSYITPTMTEVAGLPEAWMPAVLIVFGLGMIAGNIGGAWFADRALMPTVAGVLVWSILVCLTFPFAAQHPASALFNLFLVATTVALAPALQIRLMDVAGDAQTLAAALNHSAFNLANALGAWLGGMVIIAGHGWTATGWVGAALAAGGLAVFGASMWLARTTPGNVVRA